MGAAAYIGRVGGLAVALGVGTAIATGHGVAVAETPDSGPPSSGSTTSEQSDTQSTDPTGTPTTPGTDSPTTTTTTTSTTTTSTTTDAEADADEAEIDEAEVRDPEPTEETEPTDTVEPTPEPSDKVEPTPEPSETVEPTPTETPGPTEPSKTPEPQPESSATESAPPSPTATVSAGPTSTSASDTGRTLEELQDPAKNIQEAGTVAVFANARSLAAATTDTAPLAAAVDIAPAAAAAPDLFTTIANAVTNVVTSVVNWILNPFGNSAEPPLIWSLLAFVRREFENFFAALTGRPQQTATPQTFSLVPGGPTPPYLPFPNAQVSPSTQFVGWVTGDYLYTDPLLANTWTRYSVGGTDLGIMWDNGIPDDLSTPDINEHQILIAVGDTFLDGNMTVDWRSNTIFRSSDTDLSDGIQIPDGQWYTGNMFGGAPLGPDGHPTRARQVIWPDGLPAGITLIPTAGISVPKPGSKYGAIQYVSFMSVTQWGAPGTWTTNYSAIAWSDDNGEIFHVAPETVRYNQPWTGNQNFQQSAFVRPGDGYVYMYGTPNGRQGYAYVSRVAENDILNLSKYEYYNAGNPGWLFGWGATPAGWHRNNPAAATPVFGKDEGACGIGNAGNRVSEMSVQYNKQLNKYVALYADQFNNIVMRTSDAPQGGWSAAKVLMGQQNGGIYAPMMHPWSPSTQGTGTDLYWNLSLWSEYNVMLMKTDLSKV